jgi:hypothetical protein
MHHFLGFYRSRRVKPSLKNGASTPFLMNVTLGIRVSIGITVALIFGDEIVLIWSNAFQLTFHAFFLS